MGDEARSPREEVQQLLGLIQELLGSAQRKNLIISQLTDLVARRLCSAPTRTDVDRRLALDSEAHNLFQWKNTEPPDGGIVIPESAVPSVETSTCRASPISFPTYFTNRSCHLLDVFVSSEWKGETPPKSKLTDDKSRSRVECSKTGGDAASLTIEKLPRDSAEKSSHLETTTPTKTKRRDPVGEESSSKTVPKPVPQANCSTHSFIPRILVTPQPIKKTENNGRPLNFKPSPSFIRRIVTQTIISRINAAKAAPCPVWKAGTPSAAIFQLTRRTVYDQAFERAGSGESLTLQILNVEGNAAVIHAWVSQQPMSGCPLEITRMDELVTYFALSAKSNTIFRPRLTQAVAVRPNGQPIWSRGEVVDETDNHIIIWLADHGGFLKLPALSDDILPLNEKLASHPVWVWRPRIAGFYPSMHDEATIAGLRLHLVGRSLPASLILLHPFPLVRLFQTAPRLARPLEITSVILHQRLQRKALAPCYGIILHVPKKPTLYDFLLINLQDVCQLQAIQQRVYEDTRSRLTVGPEDLLVAVQFQGMFYRAFVLSDLQPNGTVHVELADYGEHLVVPIGHLYGLTTPVAKLQPLSFMCTLAEMSPDGNAEDWTLTACRLKSMCRSVVVYSIDSRLSRDRFAVRIWDENSEEISRVRRPQKIPVKAKDVPYPIPVCVGTFITVIPICFHEKYHALGVTLNFGYRQDDKGLPQPLEFSRIDGNVTGPLSDLPDGGIIVSALSVCDDLWYRAVVIETNTLDLTALLFFVDQGSFETVPLANLCEISRALASLPRHYLAVILDGAETALSGFLNPEHLSLADLGPNFLGKKCQLEVTAVDDWFFRAILHQNGDLIK